MQNKTNSQLNYRKIFVPWITLAAPGSVEILVLYVAIPAFLLLDPILLWARSLRNVVNTGSADVPNIIFLHPGQFIHFAALRFSQGGLTGPYAYVIFLPLAALILIFKVAGLPSQLVISGITLASGYLGMATLVRSFDQEGSNPTRRWAGAVSGTVFILFPLVAENFWITYQPRLYLVGVLPWLAVSLIKFTRTPKVRFILIGAAVTMVGSAALSDIPGSLPGVVAVAIVFIAAILTSKRHSIVKMLARMAIFLGFVAGLNAAWLIPWLSMFFLHQNQAAFALSNSGKNDAIALVHALQPYQSLRAGAGMRLSNSMINFGTSPIRTLSPWLNKLWVIGFFPWIICAAALFTVCRKQLCNKHLGEWISFFIIFTLAIVWLGWSTMQLPGAFQSYRLLTTFIPGWVATRTFYETFAIAYAFTLSLSLGIALLLGNFRSGIRTLSLAIMISMAFFGGQLLSGGYFNLSYSDQTPLSQVISSLPMDYNSVVSKLKKSHKIGPVLTLPLSTTSWTSLYGRDSRGKSIVYVGQSPLFFRWGIVDYNGLATFSTGTSTGLAAAVESDITNLRAQNILSLAQVLGIHWVIIEHLDGVPQAITWALAGGPSTVAQRFDRAFSKLPGVRTVASAGRYSLLSIPNAFGTVANFIKPSVAHDPGSQILTEVAEGLVSPSNIFSQSCYDFTKVESSLNYSTYIHETVRVNLRRAKTADNCELLIRASSGESLKATIVSGRMNLSEGGLVLWPGSYAFGLPHSSQNSSLEVSVTSVGLPPGFIGASISLLSALLLLSLMRLKLLPANESD